MKFAEHLGAHITPEWRKQYIQYEVMKQRLYEAVEDSPSGEVADEATIQGFFKRFDELFLQFCESELLKINTFFSEKLSQASRKYCQLESELEMLQNNQEGIRYRGKKLLQSSKSKAANIPGRKLHDIRLAFSEFYLSLILLQNYQNLNYTGFRKILKKHDKILETDTGAKWRINYVDSAVFRTSKEVDHLIKNTETVVTHKIESGDRGKAMKRLRVPPLEEKQNSWTTFRVGLFSGIFFVLIFNAIVSAYFTRFSHINDWEAGLRMYRSFLLIILMIFLLGINTYGWRSSGVNHVLIFELDPRDHLSHQQLLEVSAIFGVVWAICLLSYLFNFLMNIPVFANPLILILLCVCFLLNPARILLHKSRFWLLKILSRIVLAPFYPVKFADFWLADQLNSLVTVLVDMEFSVCFLLCQFDLLNKNKDLCASDMYGIKPLVTILPAWFRFAQCLRRYKDSRQIFPHLVNAGKYSTTFFVVLFQSLYVHFASVKSDGKDISQFFFYLWIFSKVVSTFYTLIWDVKMDWGLFSKNAGDNFLLREEIVYAFKGYYYFAIIEDALLRFSWILVTVLKKTTAINSEVLKTLFASLEVFRRFVWNFLRLENEHLNNCGEFRAVRDISITPVYANDQATLEDMMDNEDGINTKVHRDKRKLLPLRKINKKEELLHKNPVLKVMDSAVAMTLCVVIPDGSVSVGPTRRFSNSPTKFTYISKDSPTLDEKSSLVTPG